MNISNLTSTYINPNTRSVTSNIKNTYVPEGTDFMADKLRPVQSIPDANTPFKLAGETSVDKENNALSVAKGTHLTFEGGFVYTVLESGITMGYGDDWRAERPMPGDLDNEELNSAAQSKASAFHKLLWDSSGLVNVSNYDDKAYAKWNEDVCSVLESFGIDTSKDFSINGVKYSRNEKGYFESEHSFAAKEAYEMLKNNNRSYALADESTKKRVHYMSDYYLGSSPEEVRTAWQETLEETGINPFQSGYVSTLQQLATEQDFVTGGNDQFFGESIESSVDAINTILDRIENPLPRKNKEDESKMMDVDQEKEFYSTLLSKII